MLLSVLEDLNWQVYNDGRAKATNRSFDRRDIRQFLILAVNEVWRILYASSRRNKDGVPFYFVSPTLSIQPFTLGDSNLIGMRRADMSEMELFRMPHDMHFISIYPKGCNDGGDYKSISLVDPGEEYFYAGNPQFKSFRFARVMGRGLNTYNLPPCVTGLDVEATFHSDAIDPEISSDVAYDASNIVLGRFVGIPEFQNMQTDNSFSPAQKMLRQRLPSQQPQIPE